MSCERKRCQKHENTRYDKKYSNLHSEVEVGTLVALLLICSLSQQRFSDVCRLVRNIKKAVTLNCI